MRTTAQTIVHDARGFVVDEVVGRTSTRRAESAWRDVTDIVAWKRDLLVTDRVCLALRRQDGYVIELHEEMAQWTLLLDHLPAYLPRCRSVTEWWPEVATPAFAANPTVIYHRG